MLETGTPVEWDAVAEHEEWGRVSGGPAAF